MLAHKIIFCFALAVVSLLPATVEPVASQKQPSKQEKATVKEILKFGDNPGNLRMQLYTPTRISAKKKTSLVVALHGCGGSAAQFSNAGFNELADKYGFYVLYPEQKEENHRLLCFHQRIASNPAAGEREFDSIMQMIRFMIAERHGNADRIFIVGFSSGGQVANILAATYPNMFRALAIIGAGGYICEWEHAGIADFAPCFEFDEEHPQKKTVSRGKLPKRWPRASIWHGTADKNVFFYTMQMAIGQWKRVHRITRSSVRRTLGDIFHYETWKNARGRTVVEAYTMQDTAHTIPVTKTCGRAGGFFKEETICFAEKAIEFFGLK
ncbi:MAG: PHB depolymerase family esterase [Spirochaetes bacterium]|nr:PHB depolymerase family esterase [Spirochaetota bacterium]